MSEETTLLKDKQEENKDYNTTDPVPIPEKMDSESKHILLSLMFSTIACYLLVGNIVTYLPLMAETKYEDINSIESGIMLCCQQLTTMILSPFVGKYLDRIGKKNSIVIGLSMTIAVAIGCGMLSFSKNGYWFLFSAILCRIMQGASMSFIMTSVFAILPMQFPVNREKYQGYIEMCLGIGVFTGFMLCGILYQYIGYLGMFLLSGSLQIIQTIVCLKLLPQRLNTIQNIQPRSSLIQGSKANNASKYHTFFFLKYLDITLMFLLVVLEGATVFHYENVLSVYLTGTLGMSEDYIGYIFAVKSFVYGAMSYLTPRYICKWFARRTIICLGIFWLATANAFLGSTQFLGLPQAIWCVCVGMFSNGIGCALMFVCIWPETVPMILEKIPEEDTEVVIDKLAGIYYSAAMGGYFLAPILSGCLVYAKNFRFDCNIMMLSDILMGLGYLFIFIIFPHVFFKAYPKDLSNHDENEKQPLSNGNKEE